MASVQAHAALVARLEEQSRQQPGWYRLKLALLAGLGYAVLGGALVVALALSLGLVALVVLTKSVWLVKLVKVAWIPLVVAWMILRALWVRIDPPAGERITRREAPVLFDEIDRLRAATGAPKLAGVVIDPDLNAGAAAVPRLLGLLGHRQWLVLGLPLMQALDRAQFASVLAHEFGHMGGGHGRFSGWIYRLRTTWGRLLAAMHERNPDRPGWLANFFDWYAPYFDAYSFALARSNEYEADAMAARVAGKDAAAQALLRVNLAAQRLQRDFWPGVMRSNREAAAPPSRLFEELGASIASLGADDDERLRTLLEHRAGLDDTHPAPAQRLAAMGVAPALPAPFARSAAQELLGPLEAALAARFTQRWCADNGAAWRSVHERAEQARARRRELETGDAATFDAETCVEYGTLLEDDGDAAAARGWHERALQREPGHAAASFHLGRLLAARGDPAGEPLLRHAMQVQPNATHAVHELLHALHAQRGDAAALQALATEGEAFRRRVADANVARRRITTQDRFDAGVPPALRDALARDLRAVGGIKRAWFVRKGIEPDFGVPHYVVMLEWKVFLGSPQARLQRLLDRLPDGPSWHVVGAKDAGAVKAAIKRAAGTPVRPA